jgi:hypothetical protein
MQVGQRCGAAAWQVAMNEKCFGDGNTGTAMPPVNAGGVTEAIDHAR